MGLRLESRPVSPPFVVSECRLSGRGSSRFPSCRLSSVINRGTLFRGRETERRSESETEYSGRERDECRPQCERHT